VLREENAFVEVRLQLPAVGRMRLGDVDEDGVGPVAVRAIERVDVARPATKRRSGEAAEDEDERAAGDERVEPDRAVVCVAEELEIRQRIADAEPVRPAEARDRRENGLPLVRGKRPRVVGVTRVEVRLGHDS
jgi:hypothetical protein